MSKERTAKNCCVQDPMVEGREDVLELDWRDYVEKLSWSRLRIKPEHLPSVVEQWFLTFLLAAPLLYHQPILTTPFKID